MCCCSVSDTLDDLLQLADKPIKPKKKAKSKPAGPHPVSLFDDSEDQNKVTDMGADDILKYIQQNQTVDDDLDLFWYISFGVPISFLCLYNMQLNISCSNLLNYNIFLWMMR